MKRYYVYENRHFTANRMCNGDKYCAFVSEVKKPHKCLHCKGNINKDDFAFIECVDATSELDALHKCKESDLWLQAGVMRAVRAIGDLIDKGMKK